MRDRCDVEKMNTKQWRRFVVIDERWGHVAHFLVYLFQVLVFYALYRVKWKRE